jgi:hypothetical protein
MSSNIVTSFSSSWCVHECMILIRLASLLLTSEFSLYPISIEYKSKRNAGMSSTTIVWVLHTNGEISPGELLLHPPTKYLPDWSRQQGYVLVQTRSGGRRQRFHRGRWHHSVWPWHAPPPLAKEGAGFWSTAASIALSGTIRVTNKTETNIVAGVYRKSVKHAALLETLPLDYPNQQRSTGITGSVTVTTLQTVDNVAVKKFAETHK